ncbi:MAG: chromate efflux transporter [Chloroflexi bacterium]|nr:chromate efflux transporter [Chloroflexota bacterium]
MDSPQPRLHRLLELAGLFVKLGLTSFGGPVGHIALMENEAVHKRRWLSREYFLDLLAATNLVPGPNATEMAIHIGYVRAGWPGLVVSGAAFILPAFFITLALAWAYVEYGALPQVGAILYGIKPVVVGIVAVAVYRLGKAALTELKAGLLFVAVLILSFFRLNEVALLLASGVAGVLLYTPPSLRPWMTAGMGLGFSLPSLSGVLPSRLLQIGLYFLKVGSLLFGSGLLLFAFVQHDVVESYGWLTPQQLVDAIAAGQVTPGPVLSSATFIGYLLEGTPGAVVATIAVFLPSFLIVSLTGPWIPRLRDSKGAYAFLRGVTAGALALILGTGLLLARAAVVDIWTALLAIASLGILWRTELDVVWVIAGGAIIGWLRYWLGS